LPDVASAQLRVSPVDWVQGRGEIPHPAMNGRTTLLQAIAEGGNCGGNYQYRWDWNGDGDYDDGNENWRGSGAGGHRSGYWAQLGLEVQFPNQPGDRLYYPKVEVDCAGQRQATTFPVLVRVDRLCPNYPGDINGGCRDEENIRLTRALVHDREVDRGLWWMFNRMSHYGDDGRRGGIHSCVFWGGPTMYGHGHSINTYERRSHGFGPGRDSDVYYRHASYCLLNALIGTYNRSGGLWFDDDGGRGENGIRYQYTNARLGGSWYWGSYGSTSWVEPIANYGSATYQAPGGEGGIQGRTLAWIGGDLADGVIHCMGGSGQWFYGCRSDGHADASTNGWAPEAMRLLERKFGTNTYGWAKDRQRGWLNAHCSGNSNNDHRLFGCSYHNEWCCNGGVGKLAGNALVGYGWTQNENWNNDAGGARWRMNEHWRAATRLDHNWWGLYYMYATTKGMRSFLPEIDRMEDGRDWAVYFANFLVNINYDDQWWRWCSNENDRQCHHHWKGSWNRDTSTALSVQIVQTWLEAQALARATPQSTGPGIDVTFDHSWSHILDPAATLTRFRWNVRDEPGEDANGNGIAEYSEMVWEYSTADIDDPFIFAYDEDLNWDDVINWKVTLEVQDSAGRLVYDDKSVQITLSLKNHVPIVIGHPDGLNGMYSGYFGQDIILDASATYDVDTDHEVFPGQGNRPRGIPDRITSICYDLDLDDNWCEAGENATVFPLTFVPRQNMAEGDRIGIPIRACDDGRWNGKCYQPGDGGPPELTRGDCTECAYGSVGLSVVENVDPPVIDLGGNDGVYEVTPGVPLQLDFSGTRDPEGVLGNLTQDGGVRFSYELQGAGRIAPTPGYEGGDGNWGPRPIFTPIGDGDDNTVIRVAATDFGNMTSNAEGRLHLNNMPPTLDNWEIRIEPRAVNVSDNIEIVNLGRRRYRAEITATPAVGTAAMIDYETTEPYNEPVTVTADMNEDGNADLQSNRRQGTIGPHVYVEYGPTDMSLSVSDGEDTVTETRNVDVPEPPPPDPRELRFFIDIGADGAFEASGNNRPNVEFFVPGGLSELTIAGFVRSPGGTTTFRYDVILPNTNPRMTVARVVSVTGFDVVVTASATDMDGDPLTYIIDWGDGNVTRSRGIVNRHRYPAGIFRTYTINVSVDDNRGGVSSRRLEVVFAEPEIRDAEISSLSWTRMTETEGSYDGVRAFAIAPDGVIITHNYLDQLRRSTDGGENWATVMENVECCGTVVARDPRQFVAATPGGLFYTENNGDNWALWDEGKFKAVVVSPDRTHFVAAIASEVKRFDLTGGLVDTFFMDNEEQFHDMAACESRSGLTTRNGSLYINDARDLAPAGWQIPEERFGKGNGESSVSFDKDCNLYQGLWNGYRMLKMNGEIVPSTTKAPKNQIHVAGYHPKNIYQGTGTVTDIMAWPGGPYLVGAVRGVWGEEEAWNAYRKPYWKVRNRGIDRSTTVRQFGLHPVNGHLYLATSSAVQVPKYCRKARRANRRRRRRRRRRARVQYYYVFCGFNYHYYGGLYRSTDPLLSSRVIGGGGRAFDEINASGTAFSPQQGGLVVSLEEEDTGYMWLPNTAESTISKWDPTNSPPRELGRYRVGLPQGECPGQCCWNGGCNMPSRVGIDGHGDSYVANRGFGMQGTVTKVAARIEDCVDRNNNGAIETSRGAVPMDYGADECILWTANVGPPNSVLRALAIDMGDAQEPDGYVWVGGYENSKMWKMHPDDGRVLAEFDVNVQPYGAVATADGSMWLSTLGDGSLQSINTRTGDVNPTVANPAGLRGGCASSYGIGLDQFGRIWMNGWGCPDAIAYDPRDGTWCRMSLPFNMTVGRGITVDADGRMWAAVGGDGQSHVAYWDATDCVSGQSTEVPNNQLIQSPPDTIGPSAIGADLQGRIWLAHKDTQRLVRIDPDNGFAMDAFPGTNRVYSYSDFTGIVRRLGIGRGNYIEDFEASCNAPTWTNLSWRARLPNGARLNFVAYTAQDRDKLNEADPVQVAVIPGDDPPMDVDAAFQAAGIASRRFLRLRVNFILNGENESPVLESFAMRWTCE
jgi:hypothetical protein